MIISSRNITQYDKPMSKREITALRNQDKYFDIAYQDWKKSHYGIIIDFYQNIHFTAPVIEIYIKYIAGNKVYTYEYREDI